MAQQFQELQQPCIKKGCGLPATVNSSYCEKHDARMQAKNTYNYYNPRYCEPVDQTVETMVCHLFSLFSSVSFSLLSHSLTHSLPSISSQTHFR